MKNIPELVDNSGIPSNKWCVYRYDRQEERYDPNEGEFILSPPKFMEVIIVNLPSRLIARRILGLLQTIEDGVRNAANPIRGDELGGGDEDEIVMNTNPNYRVCVDTYSFLGHWRRHTLFSDNAPAWTRIRMGEDIEPNEPDEAITPGRIFTFGNLDTTITPTLTDRDLEFIENDQPREPVVNAPAGNRDTP